MLIHIVCPKLDIVVENNEGERVMSYHIENYALRADIKGLVAAGIAVAKEVKEKIRGLDGQHS